MKKWMISAKKADFNAIAEKYHISPITARLIRNRDIVGDREIDLFLNGKLSDLPKPEEMKDLQKAAGILKEKIGAGKKIRVIGDYDADGVMSAYILVKGLARLGAQVDWRIPDRIADGYDLNENLIRQAHAEGCDTVITCDNGISAAEPAALAAALGMTVLITDHHNVPYEDTAAGRHYLVPEAAAVVDPKQEDCGYPCKFICGAVVAWKLIAFMYEEAGLPEEEALAFLPFAAFATITDVCELKEENRIIVREGLKALNRTDNPGLCALIAASGAEKGKLDVYHIGYILGPCINASGRLKSADLALSLLLCEDEREAKALAEELTELNQYRKTMTEEGVEKAVSLVEEQSLEKDSILVVALPDCHESIAGIIAGRLKEKYSRPAFVLTRTEDGLKGSGRSVEAYSMYDGLVRVQDLLSRFGGHPKAAGLSLLPENLAEFRRRLNEDCGLSPEDMAEKVHIDMLLPLSRVTAALIREFSLLKPFGTGNDQPLFALREARILHPALVGRNRNVVRMEVADSAGTVLPAVYFGDVQAFMQLALEGGTFALLYYPDIDSYGGRESLQLKIQDIRRLD